MEQLTYWEFQGFQPPEKPANLKPPEDQPPAAGKPLIPASPKKASRLRFGTFLLDSEVVFAKVFKGDALPVSAKIEWPKYAIKVMKI